MMRAEMLILAALISSICASRATAETFECAPTLTRVMVRTGDDWKEITPRSAERSIIRELRPEERRHQGKTWGFFMSSESSPTAACTRYDTAITCGIAGNTVDFNTRTGRYVRTYFTSFLSLDSSEIFVESGRCITQAASEVGLPASGVTIPLRR